MNLDMEPHDLDAAMEAIIDPTAPDGQVLAALARHLHLDSELLQAAINKTRRSRVVEAPQRDKRAGARDALAAAHAAFRRWLGEEYDLDALNATLAASAVELLDGDPLWLLIISGSGNAKTETVCSLAGAGAHITSTIASEGALLSATPHQEKTKDATGGLLRKIGERGILVVKDVTSILSADRNARGTVLAALREIYDGRWERNVGTNGGRTLTWCGRITVVGAVTTAWDRAHDVISSLGDRFVLLRIDSTKGRQVAGRQAIANTGLEAAMRAELAAAAGAVLSRVDRGQSISLSEQESERLLAAADLVTLSRTGVEYDYRGEVIDAHAPEMPTRFAKQLAQVMRGACAISMNRHDGLQLAIRCARDSMPPLRQAILADVSANPGARTGEIRRRLQKPWTTVDRQLQALHMLGVLACDEETDAAGKSVWRYRLAEGIDPWVLRASPDLLLHLHKDTEEESREGTNISGDGDRDIKEVNV